MKYESFKEQQKRYDYEAYHGPDDDFSYADDCKLRRQYDDDKEKRTKKWNDFSEEEKKDFRAWFDYVQEFYYGKKN